MTMSAARLGLRITARPSRLPRSPICPSASRAHIKTYPVPRRSYTASASPAPTSAASPSLFRRAVTFVATGIVFTTIGFTMTAGPAISAVNEFLSPPTDAETLTMFTPEDPKEIEVEEFINNSWLAQEMRSKPEFKELRPHLKVPAAFRANNLTAGVLIGPDKVAVPPVAWIEEGGKSVVSISYLGPALCGHPGIVHGGFLATMLDEGMARSCMGALPHNIGMTANLNINYRAPAVAGNYVVLRATTTKVEGRKAWVEARIETYVAEGETPVVLADATALFVSPKQAAMMANIYPVK